MVLEGLMISKKEYEKLYYNNKRRLTAINYIKDRLQLEDNAEVSFNGTFCLEELLEILGD